MREQYLPGEEGIYKRKPIDGTLRRILVVEDWNNDVIEFQDNKDPEWNYYLTIKLECERKPSQSMPGGMGV